MSKKMLINASHPEENRVAIVVDGILSELDIEIAGQEQSKGNIYKAVVVRVETGLQAAFVDYGAEKLGFLQIGEVHTKLYPPKDETKSRPRIAEILQRGQEILVQIVKEERGSKGAALTTFLSIPGRYMVLMPDSTTKGVSRKISVDSERRNLKKTMAELDLPERMGYIVRTAGIGKDKDELKRDFDYLVRLFEGIVTRKDQIKAPAQLYQESNLAIRSIRDYFSTEMDEVLIDDPKVYKDTKDFFSLVMPELKHLVKRHRERRPVFSRYQIEEQIEGLSKNQAPLPSGGSIVLDQTEALVAIDVNSGKMSGESGIEATAFKTNLEAAVEVGRQLRLRDLGGLIVIDFIDMRDRKHIREIEHEVRKALKDDKAKVSVGRISQFGLLEMSRQRLKPVLSVGAYLECPHCTGLGQIKSVEAQAVTFLRQAHTAAAKGQIAHIEASVPLEVANYLLNQKRSTISELERQLKLKISLLGRSDLLPGDLELELHKREKEQQDNTRQFTPVSHDNQIEIALAAAQQGEEEAKEQAGEQTENISAETAPEQVTGEEPAEKTKKRRRRRRKKPADSNQEVQEQNQPEASKEAAVEKTQTEQTTQPDIAVAEQNQQEPKAEENSQQESEKPATEKPKPRPRRRSRKKPAVAAETIPSEVEVASEQAQENENTGEEKSQENATATKPAATSTTAQAEEKPQRRPRRTTKKETESSANNTNTTSEVKTVAEETSTETKVVAATDTVSNEKPKTPRAPRRAPKKVPEKTETVSATTTAAEEKPKPRPRRATKKSTDASPVSPDSVPDTKTVAQEKPKRQPRRTTKKAPAATPENKTEPVAETVEKAKVPRRPRKAPVKKIAPETESPAE